MDDGTGKRAALALLLSLLVLIFWSYFYSRQQEAQRRFHQETIATPQMEMAIPEAEAIDSSVADLNINLDLEALIPPEQETATLQQIRVDTPLYVAEFSNKGAVLTSYKLKNYKDKAGKDGMPVEMLAIEPLESHPLTFGLIFNEKELTEEASKSLWVLKGENKEITLKRGEHSKELAFELTTHSGIKISKSFTFSPESYLIDMNLSLQAFIAKPELEVQGIIGNNYGIKLPDHQDKNRFQGRVGPLLMVNGKRIEETIKDKEGEVLRTGYIPWAGMETDYFIGVLIPKDLSGKQMVKVAKLDEKHQIVSLQLCREKFNVGEMKKASIRSYIGPKDYEILKSLKLGLERIIDFGFFHFLAKPLFSLLKFLYKYVHNYGIAIILLTIIIKIIFYLPDQKSKESMRKMQELNPQIQDLRRKYKDDRAKLNQELTLLYKKAGVNPLGGCLPMLLQIPVFFALYRVLTVSIELRHAPFIFWIQDLSAKDPYYITPILMGISMLIQQLLTPASGDPKQAQMMLLMPIIFTFFFLNFPTGLVIYWLANNIISIGQQIVYNKRFQKASGNKEKKRRGGKQ